MAIMATDTVEKSDTIIMKLIFLLAFLPTMTVAGEWKLEPNIGLTETYSDNILLTAIKPESSLVSQATLGLNTNYLSASTRFNLLALKDYLNYSHDSTFNNDYRTFTANLEYDFWKNGLTFIASGDIDNITRNSSNNNLGDLISGETIESKNYSTGLKYSSTNTNYTVDSSFILDDRTYEDDIANSYGFTAHINAMNGNSARNAFWQISSFYSKRKQDRVNEAITNTGENYTIDAKIGAITPIALNPFVRAYQEKITGTFVGENNQTTPSWGPGLRWQVSPHFIVDLSYNFVADDKISDDYLDAEINWQPSDRTSLIAGYSQRFFGDSYHLDFQHKTKRLTNSISYSENLEAFSRDRFIDVDKGLYWCPKNDFLGDVSQCFPQSQPPSNIEDYQLIPISGLQPINIREFTLNKSLNWSSNLNLSRTDFSFNIVGNQREGIESGTIDDTYNIGMKVSRKPSPKSKLALSANFRYAIYDKHNPNGPKQEDYYRILSASYTRDLASSLHSSFTVRYVDRDSNILRYTYNEARAILNITKDF